jgi:hypothetical protein
MTYKNIVKKIENIVSSHKFINNFGYGMLSDIKPKANDYPYAFLNPETHTRQQYTTTYSFNLIIMDLIVKKSGDNFKSAPQDNILKIQDSCIKIILDILSKIEYDILDIDFNKQGSLTTFVDRFDDDVAGANFNLQIVIRDPLDNCIAPFEFIDNEYYNTQQVKSLLSFVKMFRGLTMSHKMINSFYYGLLSDVKFNELTQIDYPYVFLLPTEHTYSSKIITYRFNLIICDIVKGNINFDTTPSDNKLNIQSNAIQYGIDLLSEIQINKRFSNIDFNKNLTINTFVERFEDELSGATFTIEFQVPTLLNLCEAPIN